MTTVSHKFLLRVKGTTPSDEQFPKIQLCVHVQFNLSISCAHKYFNAFPIINIVDGTTCNNSAHMKNFNVGCVRNLQCAQTNFFN